MAKMQTERGSSNAVADPLGAVKELGTVVVDPTQGRDPSPDITVEDLQALRRDERFDLIERLDMENPDFKHSYQKPGVDPKLLERKNMEIVEGEHHFDDPVCREPIEAYTRRKEIEGAMSADTVERITDPENDIYLQPQPKNPLRNRKRRRLG